MSARVFFSIYSGATPLVLRCIREREHDGDHYDEANGYWQDEP